MKHKLRNILFICLTIALTLLSLKAQYKFWKELFGIETAIIASSVFELLRLTSLYMLLKYSGKKRLTGLILYFVIALFCGSVAVTSWHAEILATHAEQEAVRMKKINKKIDVVKKAYAGQANVKISKLDKDLYYIDSRIARNPHSTYWKKRKKQILIMKDNLIEMREEFLSVIPDNPGLWLRKNAAILDVEIDFSDDQDIEINSLDKSLMNTWGMAPEAARKLVSIVFVIAIEIGIILLATMTESRHINDRKKTKSNSLVIFLKKNFKDDDIKMFINRCRDIYDRKGELPKSYELTMKLRPIRKAIKDANYQDKDIKKIFNHYMNHSGENRL